MQPTDQTHSLAAAPGTPAVTGPAPATVRPRRSRRWLTFSLALLCLAICGIVFAPNIVVLTPLRHDLPRERLKGFRGTIRVGSASMSWWSPTVLTDLELDAPDGKPFFQCRQVTENCTAWDSVFHRTKPLNVLMEDPVVTVVLRADGSNVEDAMAPVMAHPAPEVRQRTTKVTGAKVRVTDTVSGQTSELKNVTVDITADAEDGSPNQVSLRAEEADSPANGHLEAQVALPSRRPPRPTATAGTDAIIRELTLHLENISLDRTQPIARRLFPDLDVTGLLSGNLHFAERGNPVTGGRPSVAGDWNLTFREMHVASASRLGPDTLSPGPTEFRGRFTKTDANCRVDDLHLKTDFAQVEGGVAFLMHESATALADAATAPRDPLPELDLHGDLDFVALARLVPHALGMREGIELKEGRVHFEVASRNEQDLPHWTGQLTTSRIAASVGGNEVAWDQPLNLQFAVRRSLGGYEVEKLEAQSDVLMLHGGATSTGVHLEAGCDLQELLSRLGKFVNTDALEVRGAVTAAADFTRAPGGQVQIDSRLTIDNLTLRRLVTRMIERRAGELQPPGPAPAPPAPFNPPPQFDPPRNRKEMAALKRAERKARTQERRQERVARREANQIVEIPVQEWQSVWSEPHFNATSRTRLDFENKQIEVEQFDVVSDGIHVAGKGTVSEIPERCLADFKGETEYDVARLADRARELLGPFIQVQGQGKRPFSLTGPLRVPATAPDQPHPLVPLELTAGAASDWSGANLFGLAAGPGEIDVALAHGIVATRPIEVLIGGGKVKLAPRILLTDRHPVLAIPAGPVIEGVELTDQFCDGWLKFIAPILSHATRCSGRFSLDVDEAQLPLLDPASGNLIGRLRIERGEVLPGPLFEEINNLIGSIVAGAGAGGAPDILGLDQPLVQINRQTVEFELHEGRIHHDVVEFQGRGIVIRTHGSVGVDQTLDLVARISLSEALLSRVRLLGPFQGQVLEIPISGTLRRPRLDKSAMGRLGEQLGQNILDKLLNGGLRGLFERSD